MAWFSNISLISWSDMSLPNLVNAVFFHAVRIEPQPSRSFFSHWLLALNASDGAVLLEHRIPYGDVTGLGPAIVGLAYSPT